MKTFALSALLVAAQACPDEWVNPCIIADRGLEMGPKNERWCGENPSDPGFIGRVNGNHGNNWVNSFGKALGLNDRSLNIQSYNGAAASGSGSSWNYNGNKYRTLYSGASTIYLQECSNICVNHPTCTSFAFASNGAARNDEAQWDDHASGDVGQRFNGKTGTTLMGYCYLYAYCDTSKLQHNDNKKQWWLGTKSDGAYDGVHQVCTMKAALDTHCKNDNSCLSECPAGQALKQDAAGKNFCDPCAAGTFKEGINAKQCEACAICPSGQFEDAGGKCTASADTVCATHSPTCGHDSYEVEAAISGNDGRDRKCALCKVCAAGYEVEEGCRMADPWVGQYWSSNEGGKASNAISVSQVVDITNRVVIVHGPAGAKVGCGKLEYSTAEQFDKATISKMPGYAGALDVSGTFTLKQVGTVVKGSYTLSGLGASAKGMFHVHAGSSCSNPGPHYTNTEPTEPTKPHVHRRLRAMLAAGHPSQIGCQKEGNFPFFCDKAAAAVKSPKGTSHSMMGFWMPDDAPGMVMDGSYTGSALQCTEQCSSGNTVCAPCAPTATFSLVKNSPKCLLITPCADANYVTVEGTSTTDQTCDSCTNKPSDSHFTGAGVVSLVSDCPWACDAGFVLNNGGTECLKEGPNLIFKRGSASGKLVSFSNNVLSFQGFKCVDEPKFCGVGATIKQMLARIAALEAKVENL